MAPRKANPPRPLAAAFELAKRAKRTIDIAKPPASGYGSSGNSRAFIRLLSGA